MRGTSCSVSSSVRSCVLGPLVRLWVHADKPMHTAYHRPSRKVHGAMVTRSMVTRFDGPIARTWRPAVRCDPSCEPRTVSHALCATCGEPSRAVEATQTVRVHGSNGLPRRRCRLPSSTASLSSRLARGSCVNVTFMPACMRRLHAEIACGESHWRVRTGRSNTKGLTRLSDRANLTSVPALAVGPLVSPHRPLRPLLSMPLSRVSCSPAAVVGDAWEATEWSACRQRSR